MKVLALLSMVVVVTASPLSIDSKTDIEPVPMESLHLYKQKIIDILKNNFKNNPLSKNRKRHISQHKVFVNCLLRSSACRFGVNKPHTVHVKPSSGQASKNHHHQPTKVHTPQQATVGKPHHHILHGHTAKPAATSKPHRHYHAQNHQPSNTLTNSISSQTNPSSGQVNPSGGQISQPAVLIPVNSQQSAIQAPNPNIQQSSGHKASTSGQIQNSGGQNPSGQSGSAAQSLATGNIINIKNNYGVISFGK